MRGRPGRAVEQGRDIRTHAAGWKEPKAGDEAGELRLQCGILEPLPGPDSKPLSEFREGGSVHREIYLGPSKTRRNGGGKNVCQWA